MILNMQTLMQYLDPAETGIFGSVRRFASGQQGNSEVGTEGLHPLFSMLLVKAQGTVPSNLLTGHVADTLNEQMTGDAILPVSADNEPVISQPVFGTNVIKGDIAEKVADMTMFHTGEARQNPDIAADPFNSGIRIKYARNDGQMLVRSSGKELHEMYVRVKNLSTTDINPVQYPVATMEAETPKGTVVGNAERETPDREPVRITRPDVVSQNTLNNGKAGGTAVPDVLMSETREAVNSLKSCPEKVQNTTGPVLRNPVHTGIQGMASPTEPRAAIISEDTGTIVRKEADIPPITVRGSLPVATEVRDAGEVIRNSESADSQTPVYKISSPVKISEKAAPVQKNKTETVMFRPSDVLRAVIKDTSSDKAEERPELVQRGAVTFTQSPARSISETVYDRDSIRDSGVKEILKDSSSLTREVVGVQTIPRNKRLSNDGFLQNAAPEVKRPVVVNTQTGTDFQSSTSDRGYRNADIEILNYSNNQHSEKVVTSQFSQQIQQPVQVKSAGGGTVELTMDTTGGKSSAAVEFPRTAVEDIARAMSMRTKEDVSEIRFKLKPEHLGELVIKVRMEGGKMLAQVDVAHNSVKSAIEQQLPQLREMLISKGIDLQRFDVQTGGQSTQSHEKQAQHTGHTGERNKHKSAADPVESYRSKRTLGYNTMEMIV